MAKINSSFNNIINPKKDFLLFDEIKKNDKYLKIVYEKIYSELFLFLQKKNYIKIDASAFKNNEALIKIKTKDYQYILEIEFNKDKVIFKLDGNIIGTSNIFGSTIDRETLTATNIKIDLISIKKSLSKMIN